MNFIIVDDEPLAREGIQLLCEETKGLELLGCFGSADAASLFLLQNEVDLIFLDIKMPGMSGIEFARYIPQNTLVVFTTAFGEFALDSYEVYAVDYLVKPIRQERFQRAVDKARAYFGLLNAGSPNNRIEAVAPDYFFVRADRKVFKLFFGEILFVEALKDYVVLHTADGRKVMTAMNIKTISGQLPSSIFARVSRSYIINMLHITTLDNNSVCIGQNEIPIGDAYRNGFLDGFVTKKLLGR